MAKKRTIVVRERPDAPGTFQVEWKNPPGTVPRRPKKDFHSEQEAYAFARTLADEQAQDPARALERTRREDMTLAAYVEERLTASRWAQRTRRSYAERLAKHVLPALGHRRLRDIRRRDIIALVEARQRAGDAPDSVRLVKASLSTILTDAVDEELIPTNPALGLGKKARQLNTLTRAKRQEKVRPRSERQLEALEAAGGSVPPPYRTCFAVMARAGLRPSEAFALQPGDLDFVERKVRVERTVEPDRSVKPQTKTRWWRRVDLSSDLVATLRAYLPWLSAEALARGWGETAVAVPHPGRHAPRGGEGPQGLQASVQAGGVGGVRALRSPAHVCVLLLAKGAKPKYVARQLGHSVDTLWRYYAQWIPDDDTREVELLNRPATELPADQQSAGRGEAEQQSAGRASGTKTAPNRTKKLYQESGLNLQVVEKTGAGGGT